ncbi:MAG: MBL fold metallo-hydrolase [Ignavibacteriaceae bacterium]|nr:MBL fold metallo-hydrolase [Ignavibacteriaceae bacterium]
MKVKFYGTRGSVPVSDPGFMEFGGNTTCLFVSAIDEGADTLIIDAGTGIRNLGKEIMSGKVEMGEEINLGFTHFHWDHIQGFPFFAPAYNPDSKIQISIAGKRKIHNLKDIFSTQMQSIYFPVQLEKMGAQITFEKYDTEVVGKKGAQVSIVDVSHPDGCIAVRIQYRSKSIVFCTDIEHLNGIDENVVKLSMNADVLIHDAQYTDEELKTHKGWGHSSYSQAIEVAEKSNVKQLIITHHDPDHDDAFLRKLEKKSQERFKDLIFARDNFELSF